MLDALSDQSGSASVGDPLVDTQANVDIVTVTC